MTQFDTIYNLYKKPLALVVFVILMVLSYIYVDRAVAIYFHQMDLRTNMHFLYWITALGQWKIYIPIFIISSLYFRILAKNPDAEKKSWFLLTCILATTFLNFILKVAIGRARPELFFSSHTYGFYFFQLKDAYWSMPSGHAMTISALASGFGVVFKRSFYALLLVILLVLSSRVLLTYHYVADVLTAYYIAVLAVGLIASFFRSKIF